MASTSESTELPNNAILVDASPTGLELRDETASSAERGDIAVLRLADVEKDEGGNEDGCSDQLKEDANVYPADTLSMPRQILFIGTLCTAMFTTQVGLGNTLSTVGVIGESFGISNPGQISWMIAGYGLTIGTFILIGGRLGDEFGNKQAFVFGMAWYALWSLVCGLSFYSTHVLFIFTRVFQGMGPALTLPNGLAILAQSYSPGPRKNMSFAWFGAAAPFGAVAGFLFGGIFATVWWPWIYWSQAIALAGIATFAAWTIPSLPVQQPWLNRSLRETLVALDLPGGLTGVAALVLFNFAWNQAVVAGWQEPYVYICLILGVLFGVVFFVIEIYWAKSPILPIAAFNSDILFVFASSVTGWGCFGIWVFYIEQVALNLGGTSPLHIAAWFIPVIPSGLISALAVGKLMGKIPASWIMLVGQVAYLVGSCLAAARPPKSIYWTYYFFSVFITTVGMDTSFPAAAIIFSDAVPKQYQGMGASIVMTVVNYSISLGLGFAGTIETNVNHGGKTDADKLHGYRTALWFAAALAGFGTVLSLIFIAKGHFTRKPKAQ